jgi:hypothetical protein
VLPLHNLMGFLQIFLSALLPFSYLCSAKNQKQ